MKYKLPFRGLSLEIENKLLEYMYNKALDAFPNEVGGMLAGRYENKNSAIVESIVMPKEIPGGHNEFIRNTEGLEELWAELKNEGIEYLGEWHTHPNGSSHYSRADLHAMNEIVRDEYVSILNPILLILSLDRTRIRGHNVYLYDSSRLLMFQKGYE
ncbi:Mov34/MPN/PAD-1 family protein [Porphyromonas sp.]|uniref:Mov34/MPN/PAD-1 family protein n=1 Tax=Porphyromonas sp. TaxID=1924944 RepID=UPI00257D7706|nr:Mov34/MPN/PAD-1 family protein [Porphyromonas sp.]